MHTIHCVVCCIGYSMRNIYVNNIFLKYLKGCNVVNYIMLKLQCIGISIFHTLNSILFQHLQQR